MRELEYFERLNQSPEQQDFLLQISKSRGYDNNDVLNTLRAVFIPSHEDMVHMLGHLSIASMLYARDGRTFVPGRLFIPGFSPLGHLVTYVSYDAIARYQAKQSGTYGSAYYFYPEDAGAFKKSNFILMPFESWQEALKTKHLGLADGVFDMASLCSLNFPTGSNLGTTLGVGVRRILSSFDEVTIFKDSDHAGTQLYLELARYVKQLNLVSIPRGDKDIDGYLINNGSDKLKKAIELGHRVSLR